MKRIGFIYGLLFCLILSVAAQEKVVKLKIVETSDVHGNYYPYNFITRHEWKGSLARIYSFVQKEREQYKENLILLDNGDILQGQPTAYYYNYIDTVSPHLCSEMMNFMKYDAGNMGNHDVETGRAVFDRWIATCDFPVLGANIIDMSTGKPHLASYKVLERDGVKIVVLGMITPAIPAWLSENLWKGLRFDDMEETARKWPAAASASRSRPRWRRSTAPTLRTSSPRTSRAPPFQRLGCPRASHRLRHRLFIVLAGGSAAADDQSASVVEDDLQFHEQPVLVGAEHKIAHLPSDGVRAGA